MICNVHWHSDVEMGRVMGAAAVAKLNANPGFSKRPGRRKGRDQKIIKKETGNDCFSHDVDSAGRFKI